MSSTLQNSHKMHFLKISARVGAQLIWLQVLTKPIKCCNSGVKDSDYSKRLNVAQRFSVGVTEIKIHSPDFDLCVCQVSRTCASSLLSSSDCVG